MIHTTTEMIKEHYYGKVYVQYTAWFETYKGLMPDEFLNNRKLESYYESMLKHPQDTYVALVNETVTGFIWYSPDTREYIRKIGMSETNALYVLKEYRGHNIGRVPMEKSLSIMLHKEAILYVLQGNNPATSFYEHIGLVPTGNTFIQDTGFGDVVEPEMVWASRLAGP